MSPAFGVSAYWYRQEFAKSGVWYIGMAFAGDLIGNLLQNPLVVAKDFF
jgi:hypothetical protein